MRIGFARPGLLSQRSLASGARRTSFVERDDRRGRDIDERPARKPRWPTGRNGTRETREEVQEPPPVKRVVRERSPQLAKQYSLEEDDTFEGLKKNFEQKRGEALRQPNLVRPPPTFVRPKQEAEKSSFRPQFQKGDKPKQIYRSKRSTILDRMGSVDREADDDDGDEEEPKAQSGGKLRYEGQQRIERRDTRSFREEDDKKPRFDKPRFERRDDGEQRPRYERNERPRYERRGEEGGEGQARQRYDDKPRYERRDWSAERPRYERSSEGGDRPRYDRGERSDKLRYERRDGSAERPRYEARDGGNDKPRFERRDGSAEGPRYDRGDGGEKPRYERRDGSAERPRYDREEGSKYGKPKYERREAERSEPQKSGDSEGAMFSKQKGGFQKERIKHVKDEEYDVARLAKLHEREEDEEDDDDGNVAEEMDYEAHSSRQTARASQGRAEGAEKVVFEVAALKSEDSGKLARRSSSYSGGLSEKPLRFDMPKKKRATSEGGGEVGEEFNFQALVDEAEASRPKKTERKPKSKDVAEGDEAKPVKHYANKPGAVGDKTRKFQAQSNQSKPLFRPKKAELLTAVRKWFEKKTSDVEVLMKQIAAAGDVDGAERLRLKEEVLSFFKHFGRLMWLIERKGFEPTADLMWGAFAVLLHGADTVQVGKTLHDNMSDANLTSSNLVSICEEGLEHDDMPPNVRLECPQQVYQLLIQQLTPEEAERETSTMLRDKEMQLRVNTLKTTPEELVKRLQELGVKTVPGHFTSTALRVVGKAHLENAALTEGLFEVQKEGSIVIATLTEADSRMKVLDMCAGAGGKTLALASMMENRGKLVATDTSQRRLQRAKKRMARAGANNYHSIVLTGEADDPFFAENVDHFDRVLLDVPCTGTGSWGDNPENKWKHDYGAVIERLVLLQGQILISAAKVVRPGGRIVYATCSMLDVENDGAVARFIAASQGRFQVIPARQVWEKMLPNVAWPCSGSDYLKLLPSQGVGGYFAAVLERKT